MDATKACSKALTLDDSDGARPLVGRELTHILLTGFEPFDGDIVNPSLVGRMLQNFAIPNVKDAASAGDE